MKICITPHIPLSSLVSVYALFIVLSSDLLNLNIIRNKARFCLIRSRQKEKLKNVINFREDHWIFAIKINRFPSGFLLLQLMNTIY